MNPCSLTIHIGVLDDQISTLCARGLATSDFPNIQYCQTATTFGNDYYTKKCETIPNKIGKSYCKIDMFDPVYKSEDKSNPIGSVHIQIFYDEFNLETGDTLCCIQHTNLHNCRFKNFFTLPTTQLVAFYHKIKLIPHFEGLIIDEINSGLLSLSLLSQEIREQQSLQRNKFFRRLSDNQIFELFAWLAKQLGNDVAGEIYHYSSSSTSSPSTSSLVDHEQFD